MKQNYMDCESVTAFFWVHLIGGPWGLMMSYLSLSSRKILSGILGACTLGAHCLLTTNHSFGKTDSLHDKRLCAYECSNTGNKSPL